MRRWLMSLLLVVLLAPAAARAQVVRASSDVKVTLEGRMLQYEITERLENRGRTVGEADYILPLPRLAAFDELALEIDGELVRGETLDARRARAVYETIVRQQRDPALVEWIGQGLLRTRVFPIPVGGHRTVVVRFKAVAEREGDALRIDHLAGPNDRNVPQRRRFTLRYPRQGYGTAWSPTHALDEGRDGSRGTREVRVSEGRGTVTVLIPVAAPDAASLSVLTHAPSGEDGYAMITLTPPVLRGVSKPRDVTFVIDVSGSMSGEKLRQAISAGQQLLGTLRPTDRFRLIAFSSDVRPYRDGWTPARRSDLREAEAWLDGLRANGGTNISGALDEALRGSVGTERLSLVLFLTDGEATVGEVRPARIAARAAERRDGRRIFTFGVGANVNVSLLEQLALEGAGTAHFVRPNEDVERVVGIVAERLTAPVATGLSIRAEGVRFYAMQPSGSLDLFAGQELVLLARYDGSRERSRITVRGEGVSGPISWEREVRFPARRREDAFVGRLWATQRVGYLSAERRRTGGSRELDDELRSLGERWGIPTALTSYLVLEPGMIANAPQDRGRGIVPPRRGMPGSAPVDLATPMIAGGVAKGGVASADRSEFEQARVAAEMRATLSMAVADSTLKKEEARGTRRVGARTFQLVEGVWEDGRTPGVGARTLRVRPFSSAYFALMDELPELRECFALGDRVRVHGRALTIELTNDGVERLEGTALTNSVRDW